MSMSGAFDIKSFMHGYYDNNVYFNNPVDFVPGLNHPELWKMFVEPGKALPRGYRRCIRTERITEFR